MKAHVLNDMFQLTYLIFQDIQTFQNLENNRNKCNIEIEMFTKCVIFQHDEIVSEIFHY